MPTWELAENNTIQMFHSRWIVSLIVEIDHIKGEPNRCLSLIIKNNNHTANIIHKKKVFHLRYFNIILLVRSTMLTRVFF